MKRNIRFKQKNMKDTACLEQSFDKNDNENRRKLQSRNVKFTERILGNTEEVNDCNCDDNNGRTSSASSSGSGASGDEDEKLDLRRYADIIDACNRQRLIRARSIQEDSIYDFPRLASTMHRDSLRRRKLIIHLDIRNTILVADSVTNVFVEEALNSFLTGVVWGRNIDGQWHWHSDIPSLKAPDSGLVTFYKYLEKELVKNCADRAQLRLRTGDFVHEGPGKMFQKHFNIHLARMKWQFPPKTSRDKVLTMYGRDRIPYHYILPGVYKLIHTLYKEKRDFAIVMRTYGRDANNVLSSLSYGLKGKHPAFRDSLCIPINKNPGILRRNHEKFLLKTFKPNRVVEIQEELKYDRDIYRFLSDAQGISGFVDDFHFWQKNNYDHAAGKPIWIDPNDQRHHHIFFDDNFRAYEEDSIIDVRMFNKENPASAVSVNHAEVAKLENSCLVQADLLDAIADEDYFLKMTRMCEENYAKMLKNGEL